MKRLRLLLLLLCPLALAAQSYQTTFPATENPISQSGNWVSGKAVGLDWQDVQTTGGTPGLALMAGTTLPSQFADATATLTGSWKPVQIITMRVFVGGTAPTTGAHEVEIHSLHNISAHSITGYETNCSVNSNNTYMQTVRWNGPVGNFTALGNASGQGCVNGDIVTTVTSVGASSVTITVYKNGVQMFSNTDATAQRITSGTPGIGIYN